MQAMKLAGTVGSTFSLALKSSLLCAAILMPTMTWAQSPTKTGSQTATDWPVEQSATEQQKIDSLSSHIQRKYRVSEDKSQRIVREAIRNGKAHQVDPELILAIIAVESTFKERAVSRAGAQGLMQVMPGAHRKKISEIGGRRALFDPAKNIHTGSRILVQYLDNHSGNLRQALLSYNGSLGTRSAFPEKVLRAYQDFQQNTAG